MRIVLSMGAMLICGLSLGAGSMTLYWSSVADKSNENTKSALHAYTEMKRASDSFEKTANECLTLVRGR